MGFGTLRVINDDIVQPSMGFGTHPHENMEIISIQNLNISKIMTNIIHNGMLMDNLILFLFSFEEISHK